MTGVLYKIQDSSVLFSKSYETRARRQGKFDVSKIESQNMDVIKLRKKNNLGMGILIGGISGVALGVLSGYLVRNMNPNQGKWQHIGDNVFLNVFIPLLITGIGIGVGAAIGSDKIAIPINGSQEQFNQNKSMLNNYSIKFNPGLAGKTFSKLRYTVVDIEGNVYPTLALGGQVWMAENLKVTHYRDSSEIFDVTNNIRSVGRQYNWLTVSDGRKLCPTGWHVPSFAEWTSLFNSLGGAYGAGSKLEESFSSKGKVSQWWSSTEQDAGHAQSLYLDNATIGVMFTGADKSSGLSVRCIRD